MSRRPFDKPPLAAAGRLVRWHRERCEWSQAELATRLGVSAPAVSVIEHGRGGQTMTALALYAVGATRSAAVIAASPRSAHARAARERARVARPRPRDRLELEPRVEQAARREWHAHPQDMRPSELEVARGWLLHALGGASAMAEHVGCRAIADQLDNLAGVLQIGEEPHPDLELRHELGRLIERAAFLGRDAPLVTEPIDQAIERALEYGAKLAEARRPRPRLADA